MAEVGEGPACPVLLPKGEGLLVPVSTSRSNAAFGRISIRWTSLGNGGPFIDSEAINTAQLDEKGFVIIKRERRRNVGQLERVKGCVGRGWSFCSGWSSAVGSRQMPDG